MKYPVLFLILVLGFFLSGCAHEAYYADREHGIASGNAFDQMIINKDYKYADMPVVGMDAIYAEHIMGRYLETYTEGFTKEDIDISGTGVEDSGD